MKKLILLSALLFSNICFSSDVSVKCYSGGTLTFSKNVIDVIPGDGYLVAIDRQFTYAITGDCVIIFPIMQKNKNQRSKYLN